MCVFARFCVSDTVEKQQKKRMHRNKLLSTNLLSLNTIDDTGFLVARVCRVDSKSGIGE